MADPEMEKKKTTSSSSSMTLDSSLLSDSVSKLHLSSSATKMAQPETKEPIPDWSLLPEELLQLISTHLEKEKCFFVDAIHARSVCNSWRSTFSFPSRLLLRQRYSLPAFSEYPETRESCTLQKIPLFLFRVKTQTQTPSEYFIGGIAQHVHYTEHPIQCSMTAYLPGEYDPILMNMLDCQILPLGHHIRIICLDHHKRYSYSKGFAFLHQEGEEEGGFIVLLHYSYYLLVLRSSEMRWIRVESMSFDLCKDLYTFRGKFYAVFRNGHIFVIDPYNSMEVTPLMPQQDLTSLNYLVPCGNEELFLIEKTIPDTDHVIDFGPPMCRVSKLDEEAGKWVVVSDLGDRMLFIGHMGNFACSGKEFPEDCGLSGNSILFTEEPCNITYMYKYRVETGNAEDDLGFWRFSRENRVVIRNSSRPVVALRVERDSEIPSIQNNIEKEHTLLEPDWSSLPEEVLQLISTHLDKKNSCFFVDVIHARSVCRSWRSRFAFPSSLLRQSYSIPSLSDSTVLSTLEKFPLFLFRLQSRSPPESPPPPSEYFLGGINRDNHRTEVPYRLKCSVKADFPGYNPILMNMVDCQILTLGHRYRMIGKNPEVLTSNYKGMAFLSLKKEEEEEFFVMLNYSSILMVLRSSEMRWMMLERMSNALCSDIVTVRGKFYAIFENGEIFVIDPYNALEETPLVTPQDFNSSKYLVPSGDDDEELFLVEKTITTCRVSKLDEETGEWIEVSDLGDRVLIIGQLGNVAFSGKHLPDGCGLSENSILFTDGYDSNVTFAYKYGVETVNAEEDDDLSLWRSARENRVLIRNSSPPVVALRVDRYSDIRSIQKNMEEEGGLESDSGSGNVGQHTLLKPGWSSLPEVVLQLISTHLNKKNSCFFVDVIHARSVCRSWRSRFSFPSSLLRQSYFIPSLYDSSVFATLEKFPLFLFRHQTRTPPESPPPPSEYFLGGINRDYLRREVSYQHQCSVKADFPGYNPILTNMADCQILPLGHHYRMIGKNPEFLTSNYKGMAFLSVKKEEEEEFFVMLNYSINYSSHLWVLRSSEMRWMMYERMSNALCSDIVTFRGKFYAISENGEISVIDPCNALAETPLVTPQDLNSSKYLVPSGDDDEELFLVEKTITTCRVSKLDEKTGEWIEVSDLGDRVLIIGQLGNVAFSGKHLPDGCGLSENSILFTDGYGPYGSNVTFAYKYGVETVNAEEDDDLGFWRLSRENRVLIRNKSPPVLALRVDRILDT